MSELSNPNDWMDFQGAFNAYVRIDGAEVTDSRTDLLNDYSKLTADQVVNFVMPSDFAAVICGIVFIDDPAALSLFTSCTEHDAFERLQSYHKAHRRVLQCDNMFIAKKLSAFLQSQEGAWFYLRLAFILADAAEDEEYQPYLCGAGTRPETHNQKEQS